MYGARIVSSRSAEYFQNPGSVTKTFPGLNHEELSKPPGKGDGAVYDWVDMIMSQELKRVDDWALRHGDEFCQTQPGAFPGILQ